MIVGEGAYRYEVAEGWERLPAGWHHGDVAGVATDSQDRVYVFNRGEHPVIVYERDGTFLGSWGEGVFTRAHGISIIDDVAYCADDKDHTVRVFTLDGTLLRTLGTPHQPSDTGYVDAAGPNALLTIQRAGGPFNRPTKVSLSANGELYISDGYGNAQVHRFSPSGELLRSWGAPGDAPGQFNLPHSVWAHTDGRVFVCDRENDRVQIFGPNGEYLTSWTDVARPADIYIDRHERVYVGELSLQAGGVNMAGHVMTETRPPQITVRDIDGNVLARWGNADPFAPDGFSSAHGLWVDSRGDVYIAEVAQTALGRSGRYRPDFAALKKFTRI